MLTLAFLMAIYGYVIFGLGLLGCLSKNCLLGVSFLFFSFLTIKLFLNFKLIFLSDFFNKLLFKLRHLKKIELFFIFLLSMQVIINFIGVLVPELAFDALWYHLTLPKIYLNYRRVQFIPGGLLYYSASPQLAEMIFLPLLAFFGTFGPKLIHFLFGVLSIWLVYKLLRKFVSSFLSLLGCLLYYSQLVVGWLSTTAYTDLILIFYWLLALLCFLDWWERKKDLIFLESGLFLGLASSVKLIGFWGCLALILVLFLNKIKLRKIFLFFLFFLLPLLPWLFFAYLNTGNPLYPYLTSWFLKSQSGGLNLIQWLFSRHPWSLLIALWRTVFTKSDILTPAIWLGLPIFLIFIFKQKRNSTSKVNQEKIIRKILLPYLSFYFLFWFLTPLNYNRFLLPLIPIFLLVLFFELEKGLWLKKISGKILVWLLILTVILNLFSRFLVNQKYLAFIFKKESEAEFMRKNLNFQAGNFYDLDGFFKNYLSSQFSKKILVVGIHNLFYLNFPFKEISMVKKGDSFDYLLVGKDINKDKYKNYPLIYHNDLTDVSLYKVNIKFDEIN